MLNHRVQRSAAAQIAKFLRIFLQVRDDHVRVEFPRMIESIGRRQKKDQGGVLVLHAFERRLHSRRRILFVEMRMRFDVRARGIDRRQFRLGSAAQGLRRLPCLHEMRRQAGRKNHKTEHHCFPVVIFQKT